MKQLLLLFIVITSTVACGSDSPTAPTPPPSISGKWTGTIDGTSSGNASVSGAVSDSPQTLHWTSSGFTGSCSGMPANLVWNLQRR